MACLKMPVIGFGEIKGIVALNVETVFLVVRKI
jgi:hypothetical protein